MSTEKQWSVACWIGSDMLRHTDVWASEHFVPWWTWVQRIGYLQFFINLKKRVSSFLKESFGIWNLVLNGGLPCQCNETKQNKTKQQQ